MEKRYKQLSLEERDMITEIKAEGESLREIARVLGRSPSTISREVKRNQSSKHRLYLSHRAHDRATVRKRVAARRPRLKNEQVVSYVREKLLEDWSPEQISGRIRIELPGLKVGYEAIYQYIYHPKTEGRQELIDHLRRGHSKRKTKGVGRKVRKTKIPNRVPIEQRPAAVETRSQFGHWEGDSMVSRKSLVILNTLVERTSRFTCITRLPNKSAEQTSDAVIRRLQGLPEEARRSLTLDNGTENTRHESITNTTGMPCFFARPYASWQRGTNENTNGLIRWYLTKGTDFGTIAEEQIAEVEYKINNRPRKCLGYRTPLEVAEVIMAGTTEATAYIAQGVHAVNNAGVALAG